MVLNNLSLLDGWLYEFLWLEGICMGDSCSPRDQGQNGSYMAFGRCVSVEVGMIVIIEGMRSSMKAHIECQTFLLLRTPC
jgi:hypothetical protein